MYKKLLLLPLFFVSPFSFAEEHPGKLLHIQVNCMRCHTSMPYDVEKTKTYPALVSRIGQCNNGLKLGLFDDEIEDLADYVNQTYYHYPK